MRIALVARSSNSLTEVPDQATKQASASRGEDPGTAAEAARVIALAKALARAGNRVTIYARRDSRALPGSAILAPGVTVEHVTAGPPTPLAADKLAPHLPEFGEYLAQRWRRNQPDIAHAHFWTMGLAALAGRRDAGVPVAQTFTSLAAAQQRCGMAEPSPSARSRLEACIARSADILLASSTEEMADLARLGVPRAKVRVVPCGVDTKQFRPEGPVAERSTRPRLLAAEPLTSPRCVAMAICALAEIPGAELVITGGPDGAELSKDKAYRDLMRLARKLEVAGRLVFTGRVAHADLPALLRSADLLVSTAPYEPVGTTAIQAMACGTPVVAVAAGAERDAVIDMTTGMLVPPGHPAQLALRVRRLLGNPLRLEAYGIAAADRARSRFAWDRIARETLAAYSCCARRTAAVKPADAPAAKTAGTPVREPRRVPAHA